jgi:DNA polymerase III alpha subunit
MRIDKFGQSVYSSIDLTELLYKDPEINIANFLVSDILDYNNAVKSLHLDYPLLKEYIQSNTSVDSFDKANQRNWYMPQSYQDLDIKTYVNSLCKTQVELDRVKLELELYDKFNLNKLLQFIVYLVNVMRENNIVWGVGRGSSVASYVLFLLGLHKINSLQYNLDIHEFLR